jgi:vanillate O-demethylase ferredoxin subunit
VTVAVIQAMPGAATSGMLTLRVRSITYLADGINAYELVDPARRELPAFTAGAHLDVVLPDARIRQYSLCNSPAERTRYVIAVQREANGRGGSRAIHEQVRAGALLTVSAPRNNFTLDERASSHLLLAGGIGITPIMAMVHRLTEIGADFTLHYCTRAPERTAFADELGRLIRDDRLFLHHDGGDPSKGVDLRGLLAEARAPGRHAYCCGPSAFIDAVQQNAGDWAQGSVHVERFAAAPVAPAAGAIGEGAFQVRLERSGRVIDVPADSTIVQALRANGVEVATSCEAGVCGTCRTRYLAGTPDHRDYVLSEEERAHDVLICCARSHSPLLVIDL